MSAFDDPPNGASYHGVAAQRLTTFQIQQLEAERHYLLRRLDEIHQILVLYRGQISYQNRQQLLPGSGYHGVGLNYTSSDHLPQANPPPMYYPVAASQTATPALFARVQPDSTLKAPEKQESGQPEPEEPNTGGNSPDTTQSGVNDPNTDTEIEDWGRRDLSEQLAKYTKAVPGGTVVPAIPLFPECEPQALEFPRTAREFISDYTCEFAIDPERHYGMLQIAHFAWCFHHFLTLKPCPRGRKCPCRHAPPGKEERLYLLRIGQEIFIQKLVYFWVLRKHRKIKMAPLTPIPRCHPLCNQAKKDAPMMVRVVDTTKFSAEATAIFDEWDADIDLQRKLEQRRIKAYAEQCTKLSNTAAAASGQDGEATDK